MDSLFRIETIAATPNPQQVIYAAMHQDYCEHFTYDDLQWKDGMAFKLFKATPNSESVAGERIVKNLLAGNRGHWGPLEHPSITLGCGYFPHSVMQQLRTHRVGITFDVQCLDGDTEVTFVNNVGTASQKVKIADLYDLWANGEKAVRTRKKRGRKGEPPGEYRRCMKTRIKKMKLRVLNEQTNSFEIGHIKDVMCSGVNPVYRVTLENGQTIDCTTNHRVLTNNGWQTVGDALGLIIGSDSRVIARTKDSSILCNGIVRNGALYTHPEWLKEQSAKGKTSTELADICNVSPSTIRKWADSHNIKLVPGHHPGKKDVVGSGIYRDKDWLNSQAEKGLSNAEAAQLAECSVETIKKWAKKLDVKFPKRPPGSRNPWNKDFTGYALNLSEESKKTRRENALRFTRRGEESHFWKGGVSSDRVLSGAWTRTVAPQVHKKFDYTCQKCGVRGGVLHAHHLVPVFADESLAFEFDNLISLCKKCHEFIHQNNLEKEFADNFEPIVSTENWGLKPKSIGNRLIPHAVKVINVEYIGQRTTYDIEVDGQWHNFIANGMVVHNSFRYTGQRIVDMVEAINDLSDYIDSPLSDQIKDLIFENFYLRPIGEYTNRKGEKYSYTEMDRTKHFGAIYNAAWQYYIDRQKCISEEHARGILPFDYRQHFVMSVNVRSLMHLLDLRAKEDAQLECQWFCELLMEQFKIWCPEIAEWYLKNRWKKARLAP